MNTSTTATDIITRLESHIATDCVAFDTEQAFADYLDDCGEVNVGGLSFMPSRIWKEMDPTAFACGTNDYADGLIRDGQITAEINGEHYDKNEAEKAKEEFLSELQDTLRNLNDTYEALDSSEENDGNRDELNDVIRETQAEIDAIESHSF